MLLLLTNVVLTMLALVFAMTYAEMERRVDGGRVGLRDKRNKPRLVRQEMVVDYFCGAGLHVISVIKKSFIVVQSLAPSSCRISLALYVRLFLAYDAYESAAAVVRVGAVTFLVNLGPCKSGPDIQSY